MSRVTIRHQAGAPIATGVMPDRVVVINDASIVRGGATSIAVLSARLMSGRGVPVTLITGDSGEVTAPERDAFDIVSIGSRHILEGSRFGALMRGLYNNRAERVLSEWIARNDTPRTIYHLHGWSKVLSPSVFRALQPVRKRLVVHAHDFFLACPNGGYFDFRRGCACELRPLSAACLKNNCDRRSYTHKLWRSMRLALMRLIHSPGRGAERILAVHGGMHALLERGGIGRGSLGVLRNPVVAWQPERIPAELNRTFLYVGRLDVDKGADVVAHAAHVAGLPLRMIGSGPLTEDIRRRYPQIEVTGWKSQAEIASLCLDARALIMPTRSRETFGLAGLEALFSGLPVVVSNTAMVAPEIAAANFGVVCDPQHPEGLAAIMTRMARDDVGIAAMSRNAYAGARKLAPTPDEWTDAVLATYRAILRRNTI